MTDIARASSSSHQPQDLCLMNPDLDFLDSLPICRLSPTNFQCCPPPQPLNKENPQSQPSSDMDGSQGDGVTL